MEDDYDFDGVEVPSYEEFKTVLTQALNSNPLNWSRKKTLNEPIQTCAQNHVESKRSIEKSQETSSTLSSLDSALLRDSTPNGKKGLNLEVSEIYIRRQMTVKKPRADLCKKQKF